MGDQPLNLTPSNTKLEIYFDISYFWSICKNLKFKINTKVLDFSIDNYHCYTLTKNTTNYHICCFQNLNKLILNLNFRISKNQNVSLILEPGSSVVLGSQSMSFML